MRHACLAAIFLLVTLDVVAGTVTINGNSYTFTDHPRVFLDGPAGTITVRVKDPDGAGAGVSAQASDLNPAFVALKTRIRSCVSTNPPCDATAPHEGNTSGYNINMAALDWYMDNSQTNSLTAAKYWINKVEQYHDLGYACDIYRTYCGRSKHVDTGSEVQVSLAQAYTLIRDQLSAGEKTAFAQKMLNDVTNGYEDGSCTNQLQPVTGAVANFTSDATTITGSGLGGITPGHYVYVKQSLLATTGGWGQVATAADGSLTLNTTLKDYEFVSNFTTAISSGIIFEVMDWDSTTCGFAWFIKHHLYNRRTTFGHYFATTLPGTITDSQTSIVVASASGLPTDPDDHPYYVARGAEFMKVTGISGTTLTVERGQLGTTPMAVTFGGSSLFYNKYYPNGAFITDADTCMNLVATKNSSHLAMGLALLDDSTAAEALVNEAAKGLIDSSPLNKQMWTGFTQGGSYYQESRQSNHATRGVMMLKQLTGAPSLDYSSGNWLKNMVYHDLYLMLPDSMDQPVPWGQYDVAAPVSFFLRAWGQFIQGIYPASTEGAYWNYWQRFNSLYTNAVMGSTGAYNKLIYAALLYVQESDDQTDYTTLPLQRTFTDVDTSANVGINAFVSRTSWTESTGGILFAAAYNGSTYSVDHLGTGAPGAYKYYKTGWQLSENYTTDTGEGANTNMILFGGAANLKSFAAIQAVRVPRTKASATNLWAYVTIDSKDAYTSATAVTRAQRSLVHFKPVGGPDHVVVYDTAATSSAKTISQNLHYDKTTGQASSITDTLPDIVWTGPSRKVSTKVVLPTGTGVVRTATSLTSSFRENICASTDGTTCAAVTSAEFLVVHRPSTSTSDTMPTVAVLGTIDANYAGVQIEGTAPSIAVFPKAGLYHASTSFTSTHSGTGQYVVTGLESGIYDVVRGVTTIVDDETIDSNGTIAFESVSGAFTVTRAGEVPAITITTTTLSNAVRDQPYSATLAYTGGTPPVAWNVSAGALCTGLSLSAAGAISGTPTIAETCNFTARALDDASAEDTQALSITVQTPPPSLTVSAAPGSTTATIQFGTPTLDTNQSCDVVVSSAAIDPDTGNPVGPVASATSTSGPSTRTVTVSGLVPSTSHTAQVACGTVASGSVSFVTLEASTPGGGGTVNWTYTVKPHARLVARSVAKVSVGYQLMNQTPPQTPDYIDASCATGCTVTLPLISGQVYAIHHVWRTAGDATVATSRAGLVAVP